MPIAYIWIIRFVLKNWNSKILTRCKKTGKAKILNHLNSFGMPEILTIMVVFL